MSEEQMKSLVEEAMQHAKDTQSAVAEIRSSLANVSSDQRELRLAEAVLSFAEWHAQGYTNQARWDTARLLWETVSDLVYAHTGSRPPSPLGPRPEVVVEAA